MSARFVSRYRAYSHGIRDEDSELTSRGRRVVERGLEAQFDPRGLTDYERETAASLMSFHGIPEDKESGRDVDVRGILSLFDSAKAKKHFKWTDEEEKLVVQTLRESERCGIDYVEVVQPRRPAPWGGYDKLTDVEQIVELAVATETPIGDVLAYERDNLNREDLIAALEELGATDPADGEVVITA